MPISCGQTGIRQGLARGGLTDRKPATEAPQTLVTDREGSLHAGGGRPSEPFGRFCGELRAGWSISAARDAQAKGLVESVNGYLRSNFEPGRLFASPLDF